MELVLEGKKAIVDLSKSPYEFGSSEFLSFHIRNLVSFVHDNNFETIVYEEETTHELSPEATAILVEYAKVLGQIEGLLLRRDIYGDPR